MIGSTIKQFARLIFGLFLYGAGIYLTVQANVGLAPWDALNQGISGTVNCTMGTMSIIISVVIVVIDYLLKEKIGFGTILNALLIGVFLDMFLYLGLVPLMDNLILGVLLQLTGLLLIALGSYFYIGTGMGCGPRDGLMVALCKRFPTVPVGVVRGGLEGTVLIVGWLCGGTIGVGTVVAVFGLGSIVQLVFRGFNFDIKTVVHENIFDTIKVWRGQKV